MGPLTGGRNFMPSTGYNIRNTGCSDINLEIIQNSYNTVISALQEVSTRGENVMEFRLGDLPARHGFAVAKRCRGNVYHAEWFSDPEAGRAAYMLEHLATKGCLPGNLETGHSADYISRTYQFMSISCGLWTPDSPARYVNEPKRNLKVSWLPD